eukprot:755566-Hanusia_phi.AAC.2
MDDQLNITVYLESNIAHTDSVCVIAGHTSAIRILSPQAVTCLSPRVNQTEIEVHLEVLETQVKSNALKLPVLPRMIVNSISPSLGAVSGGTRVSISGNSFALGSTLQCLFGSIRVSGTIVSSSKVVCVSPASTLPIESTVQVVEHSGRYISNDLRFTFHKDLQVYSIFPTLLSTQISQQFTIHGSAFLSNLYLTLDYSSVLKSIVLSEELAICNSTFTTEGQSELLISTNMQDWIQTGFTLSFIKPFNIVSIMPSLGNLYEYALITVFGENFKADNLYVCHIQRLEAIATMVSSSMVKCPLLYEVSMNQIQISVTSANQTTFVEKTLFFRILSSPQIFGLVPSKAQVNMNNAITILGEHFPESENIVCKIDQLQSPGYFVSTSLIICIARSNIPGMFTLTLDVNASLSTSDSPIIVFENVALAQNQTQDLQLFDEKYSLLHSIQIFGLTPTLGSTEGGQLLTIGGSFAPSDADRLVVFVNGFTSTLHFISSSAMSCRSPKHSEGLVSVRVSMRNFEPTRKIGTFKFLEVCDIQRLSQQNIFANHTNGILVYGKFFDEITVFEVSEHRVSSEVVSSSMASLHTPPLSFGMVVISCSTAGVQSKAKLPLYVRTPLKILTISPTQAFIGEPIHVKMLLDYLPLEDTHHCEWGSTKCVLVKQDAHLATCSCPPSPVPGLSELRITSWDFTVISTSEAQFKYDKAQMLAEPSSSPSSGGQTVRIRGWFPLGQLHCKFDGVATEALRMTVSEISCISPPHAPGLVTLALHSAETVSSIPFLYLNVQFVIALQPSLGPTKGQTPISVIGSLYNPGSRYACVFTSQKGLGSIASDASYQQVLALAESSTLVVCLSPAHQAQAVFMYLTGAETVTQGDSMFAFYDAEIFWFLPTLAKEQGGTRISIQGGIFRETPSLQCKFSETLVSATWISFSLLVCRSPAMSLGSKEVFVTMNGYDFISAPYQLATFKDPILLTCALIDFTESSASVAVVGRFFSEFLFCKVGEYVSTLSEFVSSSAVLCRVPASALGTAANASLHLSGNAIDFSDGCPLVPNASDTNQSTQHRALLGLQAEEATSTLPSASEGFKRLVTDVLEYERLQQAPRPLTGLDLRFDLINPFTGTDSNLLCEASSAALMLAIPPIALHLRLANVRAIDPLSQAEAPLVRVVHEQTITSEPLHLSSQTAISALTSDINHGKVCVIALLPDGTRMKHCRVVKVLRISKIILDGTKCTFTRPLAPACVPVLITSQQSAHLLLDWFTSIRFHMEAAGSPLTVTALGWFSLSPLNITRPEAHGSWEMKLLLQTQVHQRNLTQIARIESVPSVVVLED